MKTPQQIRNEVEKEIGDLTQKGMLLTNKKDIENFAILIISKRAQLSILTEYDKSIKEMIKQAFLNWLEDTTDSPFKIEKEPLTKIGDNSEVKK